MYQSKRSMQLAFLSFISYNFLPVYATDPRNFEEVQLVKSQIFKRSLEQVGDKVYSERLPLIQQKHNAYKPTVFISYAWEEDIKLWVVQELSKDLQKIGFDVLYDQERIGAGVKISGFENKISRSTYVVVLCTPKYLERYRDHNPQDPQKSTGVGREVKKLVKRLKDEDLKNTVFPIYRKGNFGACVPSALNEIAAFNASTDDDYHQTFYTIMQSLFLYYHINSQSLRGMYDNLRQAFKANQFNDYLCHRGLFSDQEKAFKVYQNRLNDINYINLGDDYNVFREIILARMYLDGYGTEKDTKYAYELVKKHALKKNADPVAEHALGWMYYTGQGIKKDRGESVQLFKRSAEQSYAPAQSDLGQMYYLGKGVPQNHKIALEWYQKAAEQDNANAQLRLAHLYKENKDYVESEKWYRKAAEQGNTLAQSTLGDMYYNGQGIEQNYDKAAKWYLKAVNQSNIIDATTLLNLGHIYYLGQGLKQDHIEAEKWYRKAAEQGNTLAQSIPGDMYRKNQISKQKPTEGAQ